MKRKRTGEQSVEVMEALERGEGTTKRENVCWVDWGERGEACVEIVLVAGERGCGDEIAV